MNDIEFTKISSFDMGFCLYLKDEITAVGSFLHDDEFYNSLAKSALEYCLSISKNRNFSRKYDISINIDSISIEVQNFICEICESLNNELFYKLCINYDGKIFWYQVINESSIYWSIVIIKSYKSKSPISIEFNQETYEVLDVREE